MYGIFSPKLLPRAKPIPAPRKEKAEISSRSGKDRPLFRSLEGKERGERAEKGSFIHAGEISEKPVIGEDAKLLFGKKDGEKKVELLSPAVVRLLPPHLLRDPDGARRTVMSVRDIASFDRREGLLRRPDLLLPIQAVDAVSYAVFRYKVEKRTSLLPLRKEKPELFALPKACLLYTSDAADEL